MSKKEGAANGTIVVKSVVPSVVLVAVKIMLKIVVVSVDIVDIMGEIALDLVDSNLGGNSRRLV